MIVDELDDSVTVVQLVLIIIILLLRCCFVLYAEQNRSNIVLRAEQK